MIMIENEQSREEIGEDLKKSIEESIRTTLDHQGFLHDAEVSVLLVDDEAIRAINLDTRNVDNATDVLSFPMIDYEPGKTYKDLYLGHEFGAEFFDGDELVLGDVVISMERAREQSEEYGHSLKREVCYLVVHSILHLLGYDHMDEGERNKMRAAEEEILGTLKITRE